MSTALTDPPAAETVDDDDDGVRLIELPDDDDDPTAAWGRQAGSDLLTAHAGVIDACAGLLAAAERRGFEAGRRQGYRDALAAAAGVADDLVAGHDLGGVPPSTVRWLVSAVAARLAARQPAEPLGDRMVEGGLGI